MLYSKSMKKLVHNCPHIVTATSECQALLSAHSTDRRAAPSVAANSYPISYWIISGAEGNERSCFHFSNCLMKGANNGHRDIRVDFDWEQPVGPAVWKIPQRITLPWQSTGLVGDDVTLEKVEPEQLIDLLLVQIIFIDFVKRIDAFLSRIKLKKKLNILDIKCW